MNVPPGAAVVSRKAVTARSPTEATRVVPYQPMLDAALAEAQPVESMAEANRLADAARRLAAGASLQHDGGRWLVAVP